MARPNYSAEAKEGKLRKTENYYEKRFCRNCEEQRRQFFEEGNIEDPVGLKRCKQSASFPQKGMDIEVQEILRRAVGIILEALKGRCLKKCTKDYGDGLDYPY